MQPFERLEHKWAKFNNLDPTGMVACSSGTAALHLALEAFRLPPGSEVLVPDYTMIACPRAVTMAGLMPRFFDCGKNLLGDDGSENKNSMGWVSSYPYAVGMFVHVYGRRCDMDWISSTVGVNHPVIEDLAEAHGVRPHEITDAACWSFYKNKIVAGEEGGAVWFRNPDHAALARSLRTLGFTDAHDYTHVPRGHNYRMSNLHAERILDSTAHRWTCMQEIVGNLGRRQEIESWYELECPVEWRQPRRDAVWVYDLRVPGMTKEKQWKVVTALREAGIAARYGFKPCRRQEEYRGRRTLNVERDWDEIQEWESDRAGREVIYLPVEPGVTTRETARLTFDVVKRVLDTL